MTAVGLVLTAAGSIFLAFLSLRYQNKRDSLLMFVGADDDEAQVIATKKTGLERALRFDRRASAFAFLLLFAGQAALLLDAFQTGA